MRKIDVAHIVIGILIGVLLVCTLSVVFGVRAIDRKEQQPVEEQALIQTPEPAPSPEPTSEPEPTGEPEAGTVNVSLVRPLAADLFLLTNKIRTERGLCALAYAYELQEAADARAYESSVVFSHTRPNGKSCHSVVEDYDYYVTGENLLQADSAIAVAEIMMSKWMTSEGHRANILLPEFTRLAVGIYEKKGVVYAAQIFLG